MDPRVTELHCIMPLANLPSVLTHGILSHERAARLPHTSVALEAIQTKRQSKQVPGGLKLHQYANLYFHARNPMLYKRRDQAGDLCVLHVDVAVCRLPGVVFADSNAASDYVRFLHPSQWEALAFDDIFALDWRHPDQITRFRQTARKCAEVLVPECVPANRLTGARVVDETTADKLRVAGFYLPVLIDPPFFFR